MEEVRNRFPFGGFGWVRVAYTQADAPYSTIAAIGNSPVIEVYNTNPNQLIFTQNPESRATTGNTEPGNLMVK
jgi:apolipoprotein N-acyltransferase